MGSIGFNIQDRFMTTLGNTLVVVTQDGNVFGADVAGNTVGPVFPFGGEAKIGFNIQDRFMMSLGGDTLVVVTQDGSVFGSRVVERKLQPVFPFGGAKIGFNIQDRFMMSLGGDTLVVVTQDGSVFGSQVVGLNTPQPVLQPVFPFGGEAKIGFNIQDRFMMSLSLSDTLVVVRQEGTVFGSQVVMQPQPILEPVFQYVSL